VIREGGEILELDPRRATVMVLCSWLPARLSTAHVKCDYDKLAEHVKEKPVTNAVVVYI